MGLFWDKSLKVVVIDLALNKTRETTPSLTLNVYKQILFIYPQIQVLITCGSVVKCSFCDDETN